MVNMLRNLIGKKKDRRRPHNRVIEIVAKSKEIVKIKEIITESHGRFLRDCSCVRSVSWKMCEKKSLKLGNRSRLRLDN